MERKRVRVRIEGLVQGVFFRAHTKEQAVRLGLDGWVRNLPDGSVEAVFEGEPAQVERMIAWCHRGSPGAQVRRVEVVDEVPLGAGSGFTIRY